MSEREEPLTILNETKIFSRVSHITREITKPQIRAIRKMCKDFMANGMEEYRVQQRHWTEMFEEQVEDTMELQQKVDQLQKRLNEIDGSSSSSEATPLLKNTLKRTHQAKTIISSHKSSNTNSKADMEESSSMAEIVSSQSEEKESSIGPITVTSK